MKVFAILLFGLVAGCYAAKPRLDLQALEKELLVSALEDIEPETTRYRFGSVFRKACKCEGIKCQCCASPKVYGVTFHGCIHFTFEPENSQLVVQLNVRDKVIVKKSFSTERAESICGNLPGRASFLGYCFNTDISGNEEEGVTTCSLLEVKVLAQSGVTVRFKCVKLQDGEISFLNNDMEMGDSIFKIQAKNPFQKVIDWFKKKKEVSE